MPACRCPSRCPRCTRPSARMRTPCCGPLCRSRRVRTVLVCHCHKVYGALRCCPDDAAQAGSETNISFLLFHGAGITSIIDKVQAFLTYWEKKYRQVGAPPFPVGRLLTARNRLAHLPAGLPFPARNPATDPLALSLLFLPPTKPIVSARNRTSHASHSI